jgi:hypothetical protein
MGTFRNLWELRNVWELLETKFIRFQIKLVVDRMSSSAACTKNSHFPTVFSHYGFVVSPRFHQGCCGSDIAKDYEVAAAAVEVPVASWAPEVASITQ